MNSTLEIWISNIYIYMYNQQQIQTEPTGIGIGQECNLAKMVVQYKLRKTQA